MAQLLALALTLLFTGTATGTGTIFRCHVAGEVVTFADRPCRGGIVVEVKPGTIAMAPLTPQEVARLKASNEASNKRALLRERKQKHTRAQKVLEARRAVNECSAAQNQLRALKIRRRKGYTLAEATKIAKQVDALKETIRHSC